MTAGDPDIFDEEQFPLSGGTAGKRPAAPGSPSRPGGPTASNRPIPLKPRTADALPERYDEDDDDDDENEDELKEILRHAPAWLVSTVFHMLLLIVLGLVAVSTHATAPDVAIEVASEDPIGTQLEDASVLEGDSPRLENPHDEMVITPKDLAPVDDPLAAPLEIGDLHIGPGIAAITGPEKIEGAPIGLALKGRQVGSKTVLLGKYGGGPKTEAAVEAGLTWLANQQRPDGHWSLTGPFKDGAENSENVVAATAMALLAFQGHGDTHRTGTHAKRVERGWNALLKLQRKDGAFSGPMASANELLYAHAQATIAICELYGMTQDSQFREPAVRAVAYAVDVQDKKYGGWRYKPREDSDTSVTGWFVMALQSARMARLKVPDATLERVSSYLDKAGLDGGRRYGYWLAQQPSNAVTAEGLLCRQYLGWRQDDERLVDGVSALNLVPISYGTDGVPGQIVRTTEQDVYYWYYATQATHHMEGKIWDDWNKVMREQVPAHQVKQEPEAGSWSPLGDKWGMAGRLYVTCMSIYMLEVYYRHLPIYSGYQAFAAVNAAEGENAKSADAEVKKPDEKPDQDKSGDEKPDDATGEEAADGAKPPAAK